MVTTEKKMNKTWKKLMALAAPASAALLMFAAVASAHVTVLPKESATGAWETYTMKVPVEKDVNTNKVVLKMPEGAAIQQYEPIPGWKTTVDKTAGKVTWEAENEGIAAGEFQRFTFVAKNPEQAGDIAWDAFQYYTDGSIVEWTGDADADTPHSITTIGAQAEGTAADAHGHAVSTDEAEVSTDAAQDDEPAVTDPAAASTEDAAADTDTAAANESPTVADTGAVSEPAAVAADAPSDTQTSQSNSVLLYLTLALSVLAIILSGAALAMRKRK
ncbi:hypothetical protein GCM10010969_33210 [Saccharibacillus kuerlensis]|uniref:YncI copper-binding domain-containing protein n=1 Tax=Saccharibacillus kuerlensis TaxID=459527 RepID=A0ABQ2L7K9_9BACL|nr:hypothetical protein GCM10010969_33210 [Saccharibacillus kuerlensis]